VDWGGALLYGWRLFSKGVEERKERGSGGYQKGKVGAKHKRTGKNKWASEPKERQGWGRVGGKTSGLR